MSLETHLLTTVPAIAHSQSNAAIANGTISYVIGAVIALFIMGYLIYSLVRPEKF